MFNPVRTGLGEKRSMREDLEAEKVGKLSPLKTYFTLLKGFLGSSILYSPKAIEEGGWLFSGIGIFLAYIFTSICIFKLLAVKKASRGSRSYKDLGKKAFGVNGRRFVEVLLVVTQTGFVMAYIYFIYSQLITVFAFFGITVAPW